MSAASHTEGTSVRLYCQGAAGREGSGGAQGVRTTDLVAQCSTGHIVRAVCCRLY